MEYLNRHTVEEFEQMPEEVFDSYMETLENLCCDLEINVGIYTSPFGTEMAMEDAVLKLIERAKRPNKKNAGTKLSKMPNCDKNVIWKVDKHIDKCRKAIIDIIKLYIDKGMLTLGKTLKQKNYWGDVYAFTKICCMRYEDEFEYLCPNIDDAYYDESSWINLEEVSFDNLLKIITLIKDNKATLCSPCELLSDDYIKKKVLESGLLTEI